ncbi:MAG TPA: radical SAM protein [Candidatus Paceibacterota bacterium]
MFPIVRNHQVRGTREIPRVVHRRRVESIPLPSVAAASVLAACDGKTTVADIALRFGVSSEGVSAFLAKLSDAGVVEFSEEAQEVPVSMSLGAQEPWLSEVHFDVTDRCNLAKHCPHCYRGDTLNQKSDHSLSDWKQVIDSLVAMGTCRITISGGEPFMRKDLHDIVEYATARGLLISAIFTNGTLDPGKSDRVLKFLADRQVGTSLYVSLDGPTAKTNDRYRGKGSFAKTTRFIEHVRNCYQGSSLSVSINSQVNVYNVDRLLHWYDALKTLGIVRWRMNAGRLAGRLAINSSLVVGRERLGAAYRSLIERHLSDWKSGAAPFDLNIEGFFRTRMLREGRAYTFSDELPICDYKKHACSIDPSGEVRFCTSWTSRSFGNVFEDGIGPIWYGSDLQQLKRMQIGEVAECRGCELLRFCGGGCRLVANDLSSRDPISCERYRLFAENILPIFEREGIQFVV